MYWNSDILGSVESGFSGLIETWDVLKCMSILPKMLLKRSLIETWDVLKFLWYFCYVRHRVFNRNMGCIEMRVASVFTGGTKV